MKPTEKDLAEKVTDQLESFYHEVSILSKSKPDSPLNLFKLKFINEKLTEANKLLTDEYTPLKNFTMFDETALPTNSDVAMVLSQYISRLKAWRYDRR